MVEGVQVGDIMSTDQANAIPPLAILIAILTSFISVGAAVYMESLFKVILTGIVRCTWWRSAL